MAPSLFLFQLIKSLTLAEANFFREYAKRRIKDGSAKYLQLFETIHRARAYDEKAIKETMAGGNFAVAKKQLEETLLKAMELYMNKGNPFADLQSRVHQIHFLAAKELWRQVLRRMDGAEPLARELEEFPLWRRLLDLRQTILAEVLGDGMGSGMWEGLLARSSECRDKLDNLLPYQQLKASVEVAMVQGGNAKAEALASLLGNPLIADSASLLSVRATILHAQLAYLACRFANRFSEAVGKHSRRIVQSLQASPKLMHDPELSLLYIRHTFNLGFHAADVGDASQAQASIATLHAIRNHPQLVFEHVHGIELHLAFKARDLAAGRRVVARIAAGAQRAANVDRWAAYCFQVAHFCLMMAVPGEALPWLLRLRTLSLTGKRRDLQDFGEILFLVCHLDLGNHDVVIGQGPAVARLLKKREAYGEYEQAVLKALTSIASAPTEAARRAKLSAMHARITALLAIEEHQFKDNYFQFLPWLEAKMGHSAGARKAAD